MAESRTYPVLPLDDAVVLPGMVIPIELRTADVQAAVDAAQLAETPVLLVPRLAGRYAGIGTVATVEQIGRLPGGQAGAVLRGTHRASIGTGTTGPGAALWVEADDVDAVSSYDDEVLALAREYKGLVTSILHQRGASQLGLHRPDQRPVPAGRHGRLRALRLDRAEARRAAGRRRP